MPLTPGRGDLEEGRPCPGGPCSVGCRVEHLQQAHWSLPGAQGDKATALPAPHCPYPIQSSRLPGDQRSLHSQEPAWPSLRGRKQEKGCWPGSAGGGRQWLITRRSLYKFASWFWFALCLRGIWLSLKTHRPGPETQDGIAGAYSSIPDGSLCLQ